MLNSYEQIMVNTNLKFKTIIIRPVLIINLKYTKHYIIINLTFNGTLYIMPQPQ